MNLRGASSAKKPENGVYSPLQVIQSRRYMSHQGHQEERDLEDMLLEEVEAIDNPVIPGGVAAED